jgi:hypothetical protein
VFNFFNQAPQAVRSFINSPGWLNKLASEVNARYGEPGTRPSGETYNVLPTPLSQSRGPFDSGTGIVPSNETIRGLYNRWVLSGRPNILPRVPDWARSIPLGTWENIPTEPPVSGPGVPFFRLGQSPSQVPGYGPYQALSLPRFMFPFFGGFSGPFGPSRPMPWVPEVMYL